MRITTFLAAALTAAVAAGCATHKQKPNAANPCVVPVGGTTGSLSADTDIQLLSVSAGTNRPPDLVPDATLLEPSLQRPADSPPLNAIPLPDTKIPGAPVVTAAPNPPDTMVAAVPPPLPPVAQVAASLAATNQLRVWKINPLNQ